MSRMLGAQRRNYITGAPLSWPPARPPRPSNGRSRGGCLARYLSARRTDGRTEARQVQCSGLDLDFAASSVRPSVRGRSTDFSSPARRPRPLVVREMFVIT